MFTTACELVKIIRNNVKIDWTMRENVRAQIRVFVRFILRDCEYPLATQDNQSLRNG